MSTTSRLSLPLLASAQAQKHVTHNEALLAADALVFLAVAGRDESAPPATPADGELRHLGAAPTGAFAGQAGRIAERRSGAWRFHVPRAGWTMWVAPEAQLLVFDGATWQGVLDGGQPGNLKRLGLGTAADATNPFAAKLNKALWTARTAAEGGDGDLRMTFNKELASDVLSLLLQAGYGGRAEIGLVGDNDLQLRVSSDGTTWREALRLDGATGAVRVLAGTTAAPSLTPAGDTNTGVYFPAADTVAIGVNGSEAIRFVSGMNLIGTTAAVPASQAPTARVSVAGTAASSSSTVHARFSASSGGPSFTLAKSRGAAVNTFAAVASGDTIGSINFDGDTGAAFEFGARILASADAAGAAGSIPTRLTFWTAPAGTATPVERMRIAASGAVTFPGVGTTASAANAFLDGTASNGLLRSTSSGRYKRDIEPLEADFADRVLDLSPVFYRSDAPRDRREWSWYGLVAEDVAAIEPRLVHWVYGDDQYEDEPGDAEAALNRRLRTDARLGPDGVQYDRIGVLLIDVVRRLRDRVDALEAQLPNSPADRARPEGGSPDRRSVPDL